jgi:hypothetical protein
MFLCVLQLNFCLDSFVHHCLFYSLDRPFCYFFCSIPSRECSLNKCFCLFKVCDSHERSSVFTFAVEKLNCISDLDFPKFVKAQEVVLFFLVDDGFFTVDPKGNTD